MRGLLIALVVLASRANAENWADWVGDYEGALTWRQCTFGEKTPDVSIDAVDGAMRIDLSKAGLRVFSLTREDPGWTAQDGDVTVKLTRQRKTPNAIVLAIDFESGCTVRGKLTRAVNKIPACDALAGWSRIAAACTKVETKLEPLPKKAAQCKAQAAKLELAMIDAGCAPNPEPIGTRATECRALADATAKLARCGRVLPDPMHRLQDIATALSSAAQTAEPSTLKYVERQCKDARANLATIAVQFQCQM